MTDVSEKLTIALITAVTTTLVDGWLRENVEFKQVGGGRNG